MKFWFLECKKRTGHTIKLPSRDSIYMKGMELADIAVAIPVVTEKENLPKRWQDRLERFAPGGVPKHVRLYDNGGESAVTTGIFLPLWSISTVTKETNNVLSQSSNQKPEVACG